jgi:hypothetical protein
VVIRQKGVVDHGVIEKFLVSGQETAALGDELLLSSVLGLCLFDQGLQTRDVEPDKVLLCSEETDVNLLKGSSRPAWSAEQQVGRRGLLRGLKAVFNLSIQLS